MHIALQHEIEQRDTILQANFRSNKNFLNEENEYQDSVRLSNEKGEFKSFYIPKKKWENAYTQDKRQMTIYTYFFAEMPLSADSLQATWIRASGLSKARNILRLSTTGWDGQVSRSYPASSARPQPGDSLFSCYLGARAEIEVTAFVPLHLQDVFGGTALTLFYGLLLWGASYVLLLKLYNCLRQAVIAKRERLCPTVPPAPLPQDSPTEVSDASEATAAEVVILHFNSQKLTYAGKEKHLGKRECILLKMLLNAEDQLVAYDVITSQLWSKKGKEYMQNSRHNLVSRANSAFKKADIPLSIEREGKAYRLKGNLRIEDDLEPSDSQIMLNEAEEPQE